MTLKSFDVEYYDLKGATPHLYFERNKWENCFRR